MIFKQKGNRLVEMGVLEENEGKKLIGYVMGGDRVGQYFKLFNLNFLSLENVLWQFLYYLVYLFNV